MANKENSSAYDFEAQLELGERLLKLGRVDEAAAELRKAQALNVIGAAGRDAADPRQQASVQRLQAALDQVEGIQSKAQRGGRLISLAIIVILLALLGTLFVDWVFNRAETSNAAAESTRAAEALIANQVELEAAMAENTRAVQRIIENNAAMQTVVADNTRIALISGSQSQLATVAAQSTLSAIRMAELLEEMANYTATPTTTPLPTVTPTATSVADRLRILNYANLRRGPSTDFPVIITLRINEIVEIIAQNAEGTWYNVINDDNVRGWVHYSLTQPLSVDLIPIAATVPATFPARPPTTTPSPESTLPITATVTVSGTVEIPGLDVTLTPEGTPEGTPETP